ncbi:uncharacterized protein LOC134195673 [Corticium candelabrum]|uniref:uncharacterized protein LOC134195673 n=1 Tax=Corticium candelabrum TaxID=121492 RepID=UPI002E264BBF|nr:uncharacterized protein LOC134195673 [Corticium candelabrum]
MADGELVPLASARDDDQRDFPSTHEGSAQHLPTPAPRPYYPQNPQYMRSQYRPDNNFVYPSRQGGVVTVQPVPIASFNEASSATLQRMYASNPAATAELNGVMINLVGEMEVRATQDVSRIATNLDVDGLVNTMLLPEEEVAAGNDQHLEYVSASIRNEGGALQQELPKGKLILTNKRILFVSCGTIRESTLKHDGRKETCTEYTMLAMAADVVSFFPIALQNTRSVMFYADSTSKWTSQINGVMSCLSMCAQNEQVTQWQAKMITKSNVEPRRFVRVGAILPPFNKPVIIDVHLEPAFSLHTATKFAAKLQLCVPDSS